MKEKLNPELRNKRNIINIGTSLMVVVLMGLSFAIIAALTLSSAKNNLDLSRNQANHTSAYYDACSKAYAKLDSEGWGDKSFEIEMIDNQVLSVEIKDGEIQKWMVINNGEWNGDGSLPVHISD